MAYNRSILTYNWSMSNTVGTSVAPSESVSKPRQDGSTSGGGGGGGGDLGGGGGKVGGWEGRAVGADSPTVGGKTWQGNACAEERNYHLQSMTFSIMYYTHKFMSICMYVYPRRARERSSRHKSLARRICCWS